MPRLFHRLSLHWWDLFIDKGWPNTLLSDLSYFKKLRRKIAVKGHLWFLNSRTLKFIERKYYAKKKRL